MAHNLLLFYPLAALAVVSTLLVIAQSNPIYSVLLLISSFASLAGLYVLLDAPVVAVTQIIVYAGAIMVLFLFVVRLLNVPREDVGSEGAAAASGTVRGFGALLAMVMAFELVWALNRSQGIAALAGALNHYLILSAVLFAIGAAGVFVRRNLITMLLSIEVMLNAVNLTFIAFGHFLGSADGQGQIVVFVVMTVAAAEAAVGLAIVIVLFRHVETLNPVEPVRKLPEGVLWWGVHTGIGDGAATGTGAMVVETGAADRWQQVGSMRASALHVLLGAVLIVGYYLWR